MNRESERAGDVSPALAGSAPAEHQVVEQAPGLIDLGPVTQRFGWGGATPELVRAVAAVMAGATALAKTENNPHAKYSYAPVDSYCTMLRPLMAAQELVLVQDLTSVEQASGVIYAEWLFTLLHSSGGFLEVRLTTTALASMGPQAYGAVQGYALKFALRSLFLVASEDGDGVDAQKPKPLPDQQRGGGSRQDQAPRQQERRQQRPAAREQSDAAPDDRRQEAAPTEELDESRQKLAGLLRELGLPLERALRRYPGAATLGDLTDDQVGESVKILEREAAKRRPAARAE